MISSENQKSGEISIQSKKNKIRKIIERKRRARFSSRNARAILRVLELRLQKIGRERRTEEVPGHATSLLQLYGTSSPRK